MMIYKSLPAPITAAVDQSDSMYGNNSSAGPTHSPASSPPGRMMPKQPSPVLTSVVDSMQPVTMGMHPPQNQVWHMQSPQHMSNPSPPHVMQGGNGMMGMQQQQMQQPMQQQQQPSHMSPPQQQQQQQQMMNMQQMQANSPQQLCNSASNSPSYNQNMSVVNSGSHGNMGNVDVMQSLPTCLRNGCSNPAIDSPDWDREYCSSECVVSHCKDVFASWVAQRQVNSNSYSTVK